MEELPLGCKDAARLVLEMSEELAALELLKSTGVDVLEAAQVACAAVRAARLRQKGNLSVYAEARASETPALGVIQCCMQMIELGAKELEKQEHTVSFETAVWASVEARAGRRATTRRDLRHYARRLLRVEGIAERPLRAISTLECRELLQAAFGGSACSFRKGRAMLHSVFAHGLRQEWCAENPVARVEMPQVQEREIVPLRQEEVARLEAAVQQPEHRAMQLSLHLLLYCGLRPQEVARLQTQDVQPERGCVVVPGRCSKTGGGRVVPLRRCAALRGMRLRIPRNWEARWQRLRRAAGFAPGQWVPDVCRHTFASYHAAYFRDLGALQLEMGHRSTDLLRSRYLNLPRVEEARRYWANR